MAFNACPPTVPMYPSDSRPKPLSRALVIISVAACKWLWNEKENHESFKNRWAAFGDVESYIIDKEYDNYMQDK